MMTRVLWFVLCIAILWAIGEPGIEPLRLLHGRTIAISIAAMLCGTRALFGNRSRRWDIAFVVMAAIPALWFGINNFVLERKFGLAELGTLAVLAVAICHLVDRDVQAFLDAPFRQGAKLIAINAVVLIGFLLVSEGLARAFLSRFDPASRTDNEFNNPFWLQFQPYLMFSGDGPVDIRFDNTRNPGQIEAGHLVANNMGFRMEQPVRFDTRRTKAPKERVVLFSGGSAAWGAGATSNETTIAARLETLLNEAQATHRYVVFSLSSPGWLSIQSVLAITLYGLNFDPDWVVTMDGVNDNNGACMYNYGAGRDGYSDKLERYFRAYLYHQPFPTLYRGSWENGLIGVSALYRILTNQRYVPEPPTNVVGWGEVDRALAFYELVYDRLFRVLSASKVKMLLSSQPHLGLHKADFDDSEQPHAIAARYAEAECRKVPHMESNRYFFSRLKQQSLKQVARWADRLDARYLNMTEMVPEDENTRRAMRWGVTDDIHLTDLGQDMVARIYARAILDADMARARPEH